MTSCSFVPWTSALEKPDVSILNTERIDWDSKGSNDGTIIKWLKLSTAKMW